MEAISADAMESAREISMIKYRSILRRIGLSGCLVIFLGCCWGLFSTGCSGRDPDHGKRPVAGRPSFAGPGAYTGAYIDFGEAEGDVTLDAIEDFEKLVGKRQAIVAFSSYWGEQSFPRKAVHVISRHGSLPLIFWCPWDKPYVEGQGPDRFSLVNILSGACDGYIDQWADEARTHGKPLMVSWGLEMNGYWFPWSGYYYRGDSRETFREGARLFKEAFRYVVSRVRARGAHNVLWGFHCNAFSDPDEEWNKMAGYYPGPEVVDWLGLSVYGKQALEDPWISFPEAMDWAYGQIADIDPSKPVIVAEWGVGEFPRDGDKAEWIREAFEALKTKYERVKAAVYWHERWRNPDDTYSNLRVNSSPESLEAYRQGLSDPHWLGRPHSGEATEN